MNDATQIAGSVAGKWTATDDNGGPCAHDIYVRCDCGWRDKIKVDDFKAGRGCLECRSPVTDEAIEAIGRLIAWHETRKPNVAERPLNSQMAVTTRWIQHSTALAGLLAEMTEG